MEESKNQEIKKPRLPLYTVPDALSEKIIADYKAGDIIEVEKGKVVKCSCKELIGKSGFKALESFDNWDKMIYFSKWQQC